MVLSECHKEDSMREAYDSRVQNKIKDNVETVMHVSKMVS